MITQEEYNKAKELYNEVFDLVKEVKKIMTKFEAQLKLERIEKEGNVLPKEDWGVHESHCCLEHGCKYGDDNCPVALGQTPQDYTCEMCDEDEHYITIYKHI